MVVTMIVSGISDDSCFQFYWKRLYNLLFICTYSPCFIYKFSTSLCTNLYYTLLYSALATDKWRQIRQCQNQTVTKQLVLIFIRSFSLLFFSLLFSLFCCLTLLANFIVIVKVVSFFQYNNHFKFSVRIDE